MSSVRQRTKPQSHGTEEGQAKRPSSTASDPVISSGVAFYPPSKKFWRIGGVWYDFHTFIDKHPGGGEILRLARDRFEDCTFAFEAHHHNYKRARAIIRKYQISTDVAESHGLEHRPTEKT